ncbi:ABC transporter ATP-binding protein [Streptococcus suis]|uniref:Cobalt ABC transporter ATPase n=1 Tax=Streptococcus suis TaxID=1307 RepID=A0A0Z8D2R0_STRSU|nr:ABC transporter ATP-binding protein [Streptococcus suis]NQH32538.1 ABC transporter ATP-binding protein [Streptococcus suis]NQH49053.1 ABC transporter ATP-binding protein [Streptococcus suis]NQH67959.1 ABC transporter ATP-binding protein [Streptococcus suis]NQI17210.1 ABC transporter ATP-binding protein [Streptococcus suis]NQP01888.1 ABC transporter ATP-binding protein [Streptococcus suis]
MLSRFSDSRSAVTVKNVALTYSGADKPALQIENLTIPEGQCVVLCGESGSGKSSFLKVLNGLTPEYYPAQLSGQIFLGDLDLQKSSLEEISRHIASVFQHPSTQFFHSQVLQELVFPCENQGLSTEEIAARLQEVSSLFQLEDFYDKPIFQLSGGQKQLIALATATMQGSPILLLDEPTANLDQEAVHKVREALHKLKKEGKTIIIAEHLLAYLSDLADRYLYFQEGQLVADYPASDFLHRTEECRQDMGLRCYDAEPYRRAIAEQASQFVSDQEGLSLSNLSVSPAGKFLYQVEQLCLAPGQVVGLVGPNGSGKTSLANYLVGLAEDKKASISWQGQEMTARKRLEKTAFVMQDVHLQLFAETVRRELILGQKAKQLDEELISRFRLEDLLDRHPVSLSGGEQQRVMIVASLLADKEIFIFDEPTSGLDLRRMQQVASALVDLKMKNKLVLLISHDEELLNLVCDKIVDIKQLK